VRVEETGPHSVTLATLEGHPLAGFVRFLARPAGDGLRFTILVYSRPAGYFDWVLMHSGGHILQRANWRSVVRRVADRSGGATVGGVSSEHLSLDEAEAQRAVDWIRTTVRERLRSERMGMRLGGGGPRGPTRRPSPRTPS
ncbi:MAG TPA: hypothetical protein VK966_11700, partial [Longimicrobiales bacterium]|nr:hypothetical protein [Longimicrobiales bacterium]